MSSSNFYGVYTNMEAEMKALMDGLKLYYSFGLSDYELIIETDSKILVDMVKDSCESN